MGILGVLGIGVFGFLFGYFVMLLWNWLMPEIFGLGLITFWQAFGLVVLGRMLIGGLPKPPHKHEHKPWERHKCGSKREDWKRWKYYSEYWKEEGEKSFEQYVAKKESPQSEGPVS
jgi:hypothetical protein